MKIWYFHKNQFCLEVLITKDNHYLLKILQRYTCWHVLRNKMWRKWKRIKINLSIENKSEQKVFSFKISSSSILRSLYKNEKKLELLVQKEKADDWTDAFKEIGVYQDVRAVFPNLFLGAEPFWQTKTSAEPILTLNKVCGTPFDQNMCVGTKTGVILNN